MLRYSGYEREYDIDMARKPRRWRYVGAIPAVSSFSTRCRVFRLPSGGDRDPSGSFGFVRKAMSRKRLQRCCRLISRSGINHALRLNRF
jgi:hypothetical protein